MRSLIVLLLATGVASTTQAAEPLANPLPALNTPSAPAAAAATTTIPPMVNGKFTVGYEGRGDYLKNELLAKGKSAPSKDPNAGVISLDSKPVAMASAKPAGAGTAANAKPTMRSDADLKSDSTKATAAASTTTPAKPATTSNSTSNAPKATSNNTQSASNNLPVYVGGQLKK